MGRQTQNNFLNFFEHSKMSEITETITETVPETMEETNIKCPRLILSELWTKLHEKQWIFSAAGGITIKSGEDIYMTPKNNSPSDLKPEDIYVFDNEDVNDISEAPEHLEISPAAEIFMEIYKLKTPGVILHSVNNKALILTHLVRGNEYRIKNHPMVKAIKVQPAKEASESDENNKVEDPMLKVPILYDPKIVRKIGGPSSHPSSIDQRPRTFRLGKGF